MIFFGLVLLGGSSFLERMKYKCDPYRSYMKREKKYHKKSEHLYKLLFQDEFEIDPEFYRLYLQPQIEQRLYSKNKFCHQKMKKTTNADAPKAKNLGANQLPKNPGANQLPKNPGANQLPKNFRANQLPKNPGANQLPKNLGANQLPNNGNQATGIKLRPRVPKDIEGALSTDFNPFGESDPTQSDIRRRKIRYGEAVVKHGIMPYTYGHKIVDRIPSYGEYQSRMMNYRQGRRTSSLFTGRRYINPRSRFRFSQSFQPKDFSDAGKMLLTIGVFPLEPEETM